MPMGVKKTRKGAPVPLKSKLKKDPGVPRLPDLKIRNAEKQRIQQNRKLRAQTSDSIMAVEPTLSTLAVQAEEQSLAATIEPGKTKEQLRKHYLRTLHSLIETADIVMLILDARDPLGSRSRLVEEEVLRRKHDGKTLIFVLNKIDLIPKPLAQKWLAHLRHIAPTLPFVSPSPSHSQHQKRGIYSRTAPALIKLVKAYKPKLGSVTVGVVGYPNVGKSSLINCLKRSKVCAVAAEPGWTKELKTVAVERGIKIVDSPGVVFDQEDKGTIGILLRNVVKVEDVADPIAVVEEILLRTPQETILTIYKLPPPTGIANMSPTIEFLTTLAFTNGRLLKGGTPDLVGAARQVLSDWNHQKIPYWTEPPEVADWEKPSLVPTRGTNATELVIAPGAENTGHAQIVSSFSAAFSLEGLFDSADSSAFASKAGGADVNMGDQDDDAMDDEEDEWWDASEGMDEDFGSNEVMMETEDTGSRRTSLKRPRSPSPTPTVGTTATVGSGTVSLPNLPLGELPSYTSRVPKRLRRNRDSDVADAGQDQTRESNPIRQGRKKLKNERKRERKLAKIRGGGSEGMEGVEGTFLD